MPTLSIRPMTLEELELALEWAAQEGWNVGKYDAKPYLAQDINGFKLLLLDEVPIGCISVTKYDNFVFLGLFIIKAEYRSKGYGTYLWDTILAELNAEPSVGLYAVPKQISRYKTSGFNNAFGLQRWNTEAPSNPLSTSNTCVTLDNHTDFFNKTVSYDEKIFSARREAFLKTMLDMPGINAFIKCEQNEVVGYGLIRHCKNGYRIGPLYADDFETAKSLIESLLDVVATTGQPIILDAPISNKFIMGLAEYFNLKQIPENDTELMFKGNLPTVMIDSASKNYAVASLELG